MGGVVHPLGFTTHLKDINVFVHEEPCLADVLSLVGDFLADRIRRCCWNVGRSDVSGCLLLEKPTLVAPKVKLQDSRCPVLALLDALETKGLTPLREGCALGELRASRVRRQEECVRWRSGLPYLFGLDGGEIVG